MSDGPLAGEQLTGSSLTHSETVGAERLTFFSDAVVAIAMTLLALELPVPSGANGAEFWHSVGEHQAEYLAFLLSFVVIAGHWGGHHQVLSHLLRTDAPLRAANMLWLLMMVITPFATKVLATGGTDLPANAGNSIQLGVYAAVQTVANAAFLVIVHRMATIADLSTLPAAAARAAYWRVGSLLAGFGLSIPLFAVLDYAWVLWIVAPLAPGLFFGLRKRLPGRQPSGGRGRETVTVGEVGNDD